ncbi:hypothetical protein SDC9_178903 [bioreactor metagenome]|uniref:Uncharacterized protein n=1 Tax=bioreactor metagenome TaxID=1076179 RepID=A0A645H0C3_9ZZZZ
MKSVLGIDPVLRNDANDFINKRTVLKHKQVSVKNAPLLCSHGPVDPSLHIENLVPGLNKRSFKSSDL